MKSIFYAFLTFITLYSNIVLAKSPEIITAEALRDNVVTIKAILKNGKTEYGLGWVIGNDNDYLYIVTADHIVRGSTPKETVKKLQLKFFNEAKQFREGDLLPDHNEDLDLAIFRIKRPDRRLWRLSSTDGEKPKTNTPALFLGAKNKWLIPKEPSRISSVKQQDIMVEGLSVDVGSSGAPLISKRGIVGMIRSTTTEHTRVTKLSAIRQQVKNWGYPWQLEPYEPAVSMTGTWVLRGGNIALPEEIHLTITSRDTAHFNYTMKDPHKTRFPKGIGVIDKYMVHLWHPMLRGKDAIGTFSFTGIDKSTQPHRAVLLDGTIAINDDLKQMRLFLLAPNGRPDSQATKFMKQNPTFMDGLYGELARQAGKDDLKKVPSFFAKKITNARSTQEAKEEQAKKHSPEPTKRDEMLEKVINDDEEVKYGIQIGILQAQLKILGLPDVKLSTTKKCLQATGVVPGPKQQKKIDQMLKNSIVELNENSTLKRVVCNRTTVKLTSQENDGIPPQLQMQIKVPLIILGNMRFSMSGMTDVKLSIASNCLLAIGTVPSESHQKVADSILATLVKDVNEKLDLKPGIATCNQTTVR